MRISFIIFPPRTKNSKSMDGYVPSIGAPGERYTRKEVWVHLGFLEHKSSRQIVKNIKR